MELNPIEILSQPGADPIKAAEAAMQMRYLSERSHGTGLGIGEIGYGDEAPDVPSSLRSAETTPARVTGTRPLKREATYNL